MIWPDISEAFRLPLRILKLKNTTITMWSKHCQVWSGVSSGSVDDFTPKSMDKMKRSTYHCEVDLWTMTQSDAIGPQAIPAWTSTVLSKGMLGPWVSWVAVQGHWLPGAGPVSPSYGDLKWDQLETATMAQSTF
jgi:hypothetical protein